MKIESLSIKSLTIGIFIMIGVIAIVLSLLAGSYFKKAALDAQINSLSRVIEVSSHEMFKQLRVFTFDLGMKLGHNRELISEVNESISTGNKNKLVNLLDDPFVNGFVGFSDIDLKKIRVYDLQLKLIAENTSYKESSNENLPLFMKKEMQQRSSSERLRAFDALWLSPGGPLFSTLVPLGGLRPVGYLEVVINPLLNLPDIGKITKTPVRIYSIAGNQISTNDQKVTDGHLPIEFILHASNGEPAFRIVGYENIDELNREMESTLVLTISGFLILSLATLIFALWMFRRFMFTPVRRMIKDMEEITNGNQELTVSSKGLREFNILADAFNLMTEQVRMRTNDLQRLLDLDDNGLMCFDSDSDVVYFNEGATRLFGYAAEEVVDLDIEDLFKEDISALINDAEKIGSSQDIIGDNIQNNNQDNIKVILNCKHKNGQQFEREAVINAVNVMGKSGFAVALSKTQKDEPVSEIQSDQRLKAVEQTLSNLLAVAKENTAIVSESDVPDLSMLSSALQGTPKSLLREKVVELMNLSLTCWEHDLGKTKLELAEQSSLWPVYIDKSTPTTRTLDKYLNIDLCPKNPRSQRAIDTAEFVLRKVDRKIAIKSNELQDALNSFRQLISGIKSSKS